MLNLEPIKAREKAAQQPFGWPDCRETFLNDHRALIAEVERLREELEDTRVQLTDALNK